METDSLASDAVIGTDSSGKSVLGNYIQWLQQAWVEDIRHDNYPGPKPTGLLYKILRQSLILEYAGIAYNVEINAKRLDPSQTQEQQLIGIGKPLRKAPVKTAKPAQEPVGVWDVLDRPADARDAQKNETWGHYFVRVAPPPQPNQPPPSFPELNDLYTRMARLALLPTAELDRLLTETLDACSHRLDVWATSIATAILMRTRKEFRRTHLGCFGWVEDVRPASKRATVQGSALKAAHALDSARAKILKQTSMPGPPLEAPVDNGGFIYTPSQDQAAVAAILRSGYMSHVGTSDEESLAIDLSSERVQGALQILRGVREGQSMNALLGYLFEAGLHKLHLDKYIQPFRNGYPMVNNQVTNLDPNSIETVAASNVVDGMALKSDWDNGQFQVGQSWPLDNGPFQGLPGPWQSSDQSAIVALLKQIDSYADALGDVSIAETIFQTVRGNFERGGGLIGAIAQGQRPPDPEVLNTPRGGIDITHRVALLFVGAPAANTWTSVTTRARALAEPWLDAWLSSMLPDPTKIAPSSVSYLDQATGHTTSVSVSLSMLKLAPLDCIAMAESSLQQAQRSELENRILFYAAVPTSAEPTSVTITHPPPSANTLTIPEVAYLWKTFRALINAARPLSPQDFALPGKKTTDDNLYDSGGLLARAKAALTMLHKDLSDLATASAGQLPTALMNCSFYGVPGSVPLSNDSTDARLTAQATYVSDALTDRFTKAAVIINSSNPRIADLLSAFQLIFGNEFTVMPNFTPLDSTVPQAFLLSDSLTGGDTIAKTRWLTQLSYVRPGIARTDAAFSLADIVSPGPPPLPLPKLWLGQLPLPPSGQTDRWLALPWDPASPPGKGRVAFGCFTVGQDPTTTQQNAYAGLLLDQWLERVPSPEEKAALTFHYQEPNARPPQTLLLGVCPDERQFWNDDLVVAILQETLELVKIRTVDLDSLQQVGQVLPALYFPFNLQQATISTIFYPLKELANANTKPG